MPIIATTATSRTSSHMAALNEITSLLPAGAVRRLIGRWRIFFERPNNSVGATKMWPFQYLGIVLQEARRDGSTTWSCLAQPTAASSGVHVVEPRTAQSHQLDPSPCQQFQTRPVQLVINKCANRAGIPRRGGGVFRQTERENIDVARKLKLTVTRVPIYSPHAVAEH